MNKDLSGCLTEYSSLDYYPFHMPGHKRNMKEYLLSEAYAVDITEIEGFDNLSHPEGLLFAEEKKLADLYHSEKTHILVNGSTTGIQAAILGFVKRNEKILMARNSHKSAYNAVLLGGIRARYIYPKTEERYGISGGINPQEVADILEAEGDIKAVFLTSPTYEGVVSDVESIAGICHRYGIPLIVDEAHGAHFGFQRELSERYHTESSLRMGADVVIHSIHKTLPAFTQTALVHLNGTMVKTENIKKYINMLQSSSPSYVLMAGISQCRKILEREGKERFFELKENLEIFYEKTRKLHHIEMVGHEVIGKAEIFGFDPAKIVISVKRTTMTGKELYEKLLQEFHIQMEMAAGDYCIGIASIMDTREGFQRLCDGLFQIDESLEEAEGVNQISYVTRNKEICSISEADDMEKEDLPFSEGVGRIAGEFVYLYPPGIPLVTPGEEISSELVCLLRKAINQRLCIEGLDEGKIRVIRN